MTDPKQLAEALRNYKPQMDLVGPTADHDIRRAIARYGAEAVKDAVKRQTVGKPGRKPEKDWPGLKPAIEADARDLLAGSDPAARQSNYAIAKEFADKQPGHSHPATMKRIERKLTAQRRSMALYAAEALALKEYPVATYLRVLEALTEHNGHPVWNRIANNSRMQVADYESKFGALPTNMTMEQLEEANRAPLTLGAYSDKALLPEVGTKLPNILSVQNGSTSNPDKTAID